MNPSPDLILQEIHTNPNEDAPRLRYADWLEENGDETQARCIRLAIKQVRMKAEHDAIRAEARAEGKEYVCANCYLPSSMYGHAAPGDTWTCRDELGELIEEVDELMTQENTAKWFQIPGLKPHYAPENRLGYGFNGWIVDNGHDRISAVAHRGFVSKIRCTWAHWLQFHHRLFYSPKQKIWCPQRDCRRGIIRPGYKTGGQTCTTCKGEGSILRPPTVEIKCSSCGGLGGKLDGYGKNAWVPCGRCDHGLHIYSAWQVCQPLQRVVFLTHPNPGIHTGGALMENAFDYFRFQQREERFYAYPIRASGTDDPQVLFTRLPCTFCDAAIGCKHCGDGWSRDWTSETWPDLIFQMPSGRPHEDDHEFA